MALMKSITLTDNYGQPFNLQNAYIQVYEVVGDKHGVVARYFIKHEDKINVIDRREIDFKPNLNDGGGNFIKQAYLSLKATPEFSDALDC